MEDPGLDGTIILKWIFRKWDADMDWIDLAQDEDRWRVAVNALGNIWFPYNAGNFFTGRGTVRFLGRTVLLGVSLVG